MAGSDKPRFKLYAPGRRLQLHDIKERRHMTGSTGIAAIFAAALLVLFRLAETMWPSLLASEANALWSVSLRHLIAYCLIPLMSAGLLQFFKQPTARFVLGSGTKLGHVLLSALLGFALALIINGLSLLMSPTFTAFRIETIPPLLDDIIIPFKSSFAVHLLVIMLGVLLTAAALSLLCFGYIAPCLDIGWHRMRAVIGTAVFFALLFGSISALPAFLVVGLMLTVVRLNTDSLPAAGVGLFIYLLVSFFHTPLENRLALLFFGQTSLDTGHTYSLALIILLSGAALLVPSFVFLSGMWREQHTERLRDALSATGNKALPKEEDRSIDFPYMLAIALLIAALAV